MPAARLYLPCASLASCVYMGVERDTRGARLDQAQRLNFYPASPLVVISWILHGELRVLNTASAGSVPSWSDPLPSLVFSGPSRAPTISCSPGPVHAVSIALYPEALERLFGVRAIDYLDAVLPAQQVLPVSVQEILSGVGSEPGEVFEQVEAVLGRLALGAPAAGASTNLRAWLTALMTRTAFTPVGRGLRQAQRVIKRCAGQSQRDLLLYARVEQAFEMASRLSPSKLPLAAVAAQAGYSDQSHFGREVKRVTGFSPAQFARRLESDEAFWMYRLLQDRPPR